MCVTRVLHEAKNSIVNICTPYPYTNSIIFPLTQTGSGPSVEIRIRIHRINFQSPTRWVSLKTQSSCFTYLPSSSLCTTRARLCHACLHDLNQLSGTVWMTVRLWVNMFSGTAQLRGTKSLRGQWGVMMEVIQYFSWNTSTDGTYRGGSSEAFGERCIVCLSDFVPDEKIGMTASGYVFNAWCLKQWMERIISCSLCHFQL